MRRTLFVAVATVFVLAIAILQISQASTPTRQPAGSAP